MSLLQKVIGFGWGFLHGIQDPVRTARELVTGRFEDDLAFVNDLDDDSTPDFHTHMRNAARALGLPTVEVTPKLWKTRLEGYPVCVHAGGAVYTHSQITFRRHVPELDTIRGTVNRDTPFTCEVEQVDGQHVLWYWRRIPLDSLPVLRNAIVKAASLASGVDVAIRRMSGG